MPPDLLFPVGLWARKDYCGSNFDDRWSGAHLLYQMRFVAEGSRITANVPSDGNSGPAWYMPFETGADIRAVHTYNANLTDEILASAVDSAEANYALD
jgi:hypothetical protein